MKKEGRGEGTVNKTNKATEHLKKKSEGYHETWV